MDIKKILINAISIKEGGGIVVLTRLLNEMRYLDKDIHWVIIVDEKLKKKIKLDDQVTILIFPWIKKSALHLLYWHEITLQKLIYQYKIDCVFSQTNALPIRKLSCPTLLLIHHAGYFSQEFVMLYFKYNNGFLNKMRWSIRNSIIFSSIKKSVKITVQTETLAKKISDQLKINKNRIVVISHGPGLAEGKILPRHYQIKKIWRLGYITKYGVQKNFEVLFKSILELKKYSIDFKLILTLNENHAPFKHVGDLIKNYNIANIIENHGKANEPEIKKLYSSLDIFLFPSLCESFGFTLIEAMYYGLPIIAADTDSNREILGEKGLFFHSKNYCELSDKIISLIENKNQYLNLSQYSIKRSRLFSWKIAAQNTLNVLKDLTCAIN